MFVSLVSSHICRSLILASMKCPMWYYSPVLITDNVGGVQTPDISPSLDYRDDAALPVHYGVLWMSCEDSIDRSWIFSTTNNCFVSPMLNADIIYRVNLLRKDCKLGRNHCCGIDICQEIYCLESTSDCFRWTVGSLCVVSLLLSWRV